MRFSAVMGGVVVRIKQEGFGNNDFLSPPGLGGYLSGEHHQMGGIREKPPWRLLPACIKGGLSGRSYPRCRRKPILLKIRAIDRT